MPDILTETIATWQQPDWQSELKHAISSVAELLQAVELPLTALPERLQAQADFALRVPRPFVTRMQKGNASDPLLLQVLPQAQELHAPPGYSDDPLQEQQDGIPGLLHKYRSRVLLVMTGACAVNCRYCFRRHFPYDEHRPGKAGREAILTYISQHPEVNEVILSGGDPLAVPDRYLGDLIAQLSELPQLSRLRLHTRLPVVIPARITDELVYALSATRLRSIMVIHSNHAQELDASVAAAISPLRDAGITLLNQAVLLRGINDNVTDQVALSERLFAIGILPYYLHLLDQVRGAAHFDVSEHHARSIVKGMWAALPGFLVPRLAREVPGASSKVPVDLQFFDK